MRRIKHLILAIFFCAFSFSGSAQNWLPIGDGITSGSGIYDFYEDTAADLLYIAGRIVRADSTVVCPGICAWNGTNYIPLGCGIDWNCSSQLSGTGPTVFTVTKYNNEIYVAGSFSTAGNIPCNKIARWNGVSWDSVGGGTSSTIYKLREINGELYAVGSFLNAGGVSVQGIAKWNGVNWSDVHNFPNYGSGNLLYDVIEFNGELYVAGNFQGTGGCREIVKWDGTNWVNVGGGFFGSLSEIASLCVYQNKLYVAGYFSKAENISNPGNFIAAWDGTTWSDPAGGMFNPYNPFANGHVFDMMVYHNELWAIGIFSYAGGVPGSYVAKWDGVQWCTLDTMGSLDAQPRTIAAYHDSVFIGGGMNNISGNTCLRIAKWNGGAYVDTCGQYYVGVDEPIENPVSIFPNPASEIVTFQFPTQESRSIILIDELGREIYVEQTDEVSVSIAVDQFAAGIYFYSILQSGIATSKGKLIIVR